MSYVGRVTKLWSSAPSIHRIASDMRYPLFILAALSILAGCDTDRRSAPCEPECSAYQTCVDGICRDANCPTPCRDGRVCVNGFCARGCDSDDPVECHDTETCCSHIQACIDEDNDFFNCGGCGEICPAGRSNYCQNGRCGCRGYTTNPCGEGFGCCADGCKDLQTDTQNCGSCGHSCSNLECVNGECRCSSDDPCPSGEECCSDGCRDLNSDPLNCGRCGTACESGEDCCDGECVNTFTDTRHCGNCGSDCSEGDTCCIGSCANTGTDPFNCGQCLNDCGAGGSCSGGSCQ